MLEVSKKMFLNIKRVFLFFHYCTWYISYTKKNWARYDQYVALGANCLLFLSGFNETWISATDFRKNAHLSNYTKIHLVVLCGRIRRQTDVMKLIIAFRNFANAPKSRNVEADLVRSTSFRLSSNILWHVSVVASTSRFTCWYKLLLTVGMENVESCGASVTRCLH
jgi:hypothetical protein